LYHQFEESFLAEQHDLLSRILVEQERIEHDRSTFNLQRDRDIVRLRNEAFELQQKMDSVQRNERLMTQIRNDLDAKQKKLAQYEQTLEEVRQLCNNIINLNANRSVYNWRMCARMWNERD